jgi:hypothetical protein
MLNQSHSGEAFFSNEFNIFNEITRYLTAMQEKRKGMKRTAISPANGSELVCRVMLLKRGDGTSSVNCIAQVNMIHWEVVDYF